MDGRVSNVRHVVLVFLKCFSGFVGRFMIVNHEEVINCGAGKVGGQV